jgi:tRNA pseudouridine55 synthase
MKKYQEIWRMNNYQGWLNIYKPLGISSFTVVKKIKKKFQIDKIGHGGTLDPLAEGVLPIAVGKATKLIQFINNNIKEYEFEIKWGEQTSTDDSEGKVINRSNHIPSTEKIIEKLKEFKGEILQTPPKASAVKIKGKRAYELLRENIDFKINEKKVFIYSSELIGSIDRISTKIKIKCGKGFYVRSFARDIAESLNTKGHIKALKRTKVGKFTEKNANLLDDLLKIGQTLTEFKGFHTSTSMLDDILAFEVGDEKNKINISQGKSININSLIDPLLNSTDRKIVFLTDRGKVLSFGKLHGDLFKPDKVLI